MRARVLREEPACRYCGAEGTTEDVVDHVVPLSNRGSSERENLARVCKRCHDEKTATEARAGASR